VAQLERHLPQHLSQLFKYTPENPNHGTKLEPEPAVDAGSPVAILKVLARAQKRDDLNVLSFMVAVQNRRKAVLHLMDILLNHVAASETDLEELPSNIQWPDPPFWSFTKLPIELDHGLRSSGSSPRGLHEVFGTSLPDDCKQMMEIIWTTLADLVLIGPTCAAAVRKEVTNTVHQTLAQMYRLGLIPAGVHAHKAPAETVAIQHPPNLQMLSSKILSTLSDAVWHAHQDDVIAQSPKPEKSPWNVLLEPPGRPLRTTGRQLGPEVWIEFILRCCAESGLSSAGAQIIKWLQHDQFNRWQVVPWTNGAGVMAEDANDARPEISLLSETSSAPDTALMSHGQNVISTEVILAVADSLVNELATPRNSKQSAKQILADLEHVMTFAEPQNLPTGYLDYLAVRVFQTGSLAKANALHSLTSTLRHLRDQQPYAEAPDPGSRLAFESILQRSETEAGLLHQTLQAFVEGNLARKAVEAFTDIQKLVDQNKLRSVGEFLSLPLDPEHGFFTSRVSRCQRELLYSYGQLPTYKLTFVVDFISRAKLFGLGDWLLYSDDVDGPELPATRWSQPSVSAALTRYATAKPDLSLLNRLFEVSTIRRPTVKALRALVVASINIRDWERARQWLSDLKLAHGGGYNPGILASLAAIILRIETEAYTLRRTGAESDLEQAYQLITDVLDGIYNTSAGSFRVDQKKTFKHQVGYLLRLIANVSGTDLERVAGDYVSKFPTSNQPYLARNTFNILYDAIVETRGAREGRRIWYLFCADPWDSRGFADIPDTDDDEALVNEPDGDLLASSVSKDLDAKAGQKLNRIALDVEVPTNREDSAHADVPFHQDDKRESHTAPLAVAPIVVPDMRTLQIVVKGALAEIETRNSEIMSRRPDEFVGQRELETKEDKRVLRELDMVLKWAGQFYEAFDLEPEDIVTEFHDRLSVPDEMKTPRRGRGDKRLLEARAPNVASQFSSAATWTRIPGGQRVKDDQVLHDGAPGQGQDDKTQPRDKEAGFDDIQTFSLRKFRTRVQHK
jgi:hypothetical protein